MRRAFANKVDHTAKALIAHAVSLGFTYCPVNGTIDGVLAWGHTTACIDWKSPGGTLTDAQAKLVATGFPVRFIGKPEQVEQLRDELRVRVRFA